MAYCDMYGYHEYVRAAQLGQRFSDALWLEPWEKRIVPQHEHAVYESADWNQKCKIEVAEVRRCRRVVH